MLQTGATRQDNSFSKFAQTQKKGTKADIYKWTAISCAVSHIVVQCFVVKIGDKETAQSSLRFPYYSKNVVSLEPGERSRKMRIKMTFAAELKTLSQLCCLNHQDELK